MRGFGHGYDYGFGFYKGEMIIMMLLIIIIIALAAYIIVRQRGGLKHISNNNAEGSGKAIDILNEKLALGEITEEEYTRRKQLITGK